MNVSSALRNKLGSASLFVRLLIFLFATVLSAQAVTFALVLAMPAPTPSNTALSDIVQALRTGVTGNDQLRITTGKMPADNWVDPSERRMSTRVAALMHVPNDRVRVVSLRSFFGGPPTHSGKPEPDHVLLPLSTGVTEDVDKETPRANLMIAETGAVTGQFEAAIRLEDGHWRRVSLKRLRIQAWQWEVLLWLFGSTAVIAPFAWFFAKRIANPIAAFGAVAREVGRNPTTVPMPLRGPPEIVEASIALTDMQRQLSRYVEDRTMMVGAIAHDLRTPLMRLSLRLQKVPDDIRKESEQDIAEMQAMATAALSFVRDISVRTDRHRLALRSLIETVVDEFIDREANVVIDAGDDATVYAELNGIKRMVTNIIGNAVAYAGNARVRLTVTELAAIVEVEDDGPGVPPAELDRVFDPFYRVEQSRNRHTGGTGLGLASARAVARAHGGDIILLNRVSGGLLATVTLPL
ncbi:HAMP domain-containing sensor histidine kinase [Sphingomonas sp. GC_Shp_3]|uniref:sensor histidine kinase n=1 Tax=Sphingomonas sp. GC_Shp_3 TaxID=2937383 RepID=UPI00226A9A8D|nr:HAMP domain-containing sensor histidine kinase [Sphingomonas sp. GC_Shp_3]